MNLVSLTFILILMSTTIHACIKADIQSYMKDIEVEEYEEQKSKRHTLVHSKDSCGVSGCEYFIFSEVFPGCTKVTFNEVGFLIPNSFKGRSISLRKAGKVERYKYKFKSSKFKRVGP